MTSVIPPLMVTGLLLPLLSGCESEADIAAAMERGLRSASEAMVPVLFAAETLAPVLAPVAPVSRHGTACGLCPCVLRSGLETGPHVVTLDYEAGCLPSSGLLPTLLQGHTDILWSGAEADVSWASLTFGLEDPVDGTIAGPITLDGAASVIGAAGDFSIGPQAYAIEVDLVVDEAGVAADGAVAVAGPSYGEVALDGVTFTLAGIRAACPTPDGGTATLLDPEDPEHDVVVDFTTPGDGRVTVARDDRISEAVDWCGYPSERL